MNLRFWLVISGLIGFLPGCVERQPQKTFTQINSTVLQNNNYHIATKSDENAESASTVTKDNYEPEEITLTDKEEQAIFKWKNEGKNMEDLLKDALAGDRVALYHLGMYYILGLDFPINFERAKHFLGKSASLGFAPALDQIRLLINNDKDNPFLSMVYLNLTIAFGHTEFTFKYHKLRDEFPPDIKKILMPEIERIAEHKMAIITKNQAKMRNVSNKEKYDIVLQNIMAEDTQYSYDYWLNACIKNQKTKQLWYVDINNLDTDDKTKTILKFITTTVFKLPELLSDRITVFDAQNYLENNVPELMETKESQLQVLHDLKKLASIPIMEKEAWDKICAEHGGDYKNVPFKIEDEIKRRIGSQIEKIIDEFKSQIKYCAA